MSQESVDGHSKTLLGEESLRRVVDVVGIGASGGLHTSEFASTVVQLGVLEALVKEEGDSGGHTSTPGLEHDVEILALGLHEPVRRGIVLEVEPIVTCTQVTD
jgi:hypothetical protein